VGDEMNDFETLRNNLTTGQGQYHYNDDSLAALDRIEAEVKQLRAALRFVLDRGPSEVVEQVVSNALAEEKE
jgi:hypothetical protein